ncbi:MAG: hypothetical protein JO266_17845 [Acidobacteria bacterium]|nr:hypothetical protein [Acidobacteriota bacterium]
MRRLPLWLKLVWTIWLMIWVPVYWSRYGPQNFLYFCDLGNLLIGLALWTENALLFSWQAVGLLLFQTLYIIDLAGAAFSGRHIIGGTEYMFDPHIPLPIRLLSLFHLVTPPLLLWAVCRLGYDPRGWKCETLMTWLVLPVNYFWRPQYNINWARGLFMREQHVVPGPLFLTAYLIAVPLLVYYPTHLFLKHWTRRRNTNADHMEELK